MANVNTTAFSDAIKRQYEKRLLTRALPRLVHGRYGLVATLSGYGSLEWRKYGSLSAITTPLTEGTTPSESTAPTITTIVSAPSFYGSFLWYTDQLEMQSFDPIVSEMVSVLGEQAGLSVDTIVRNTLHAGATADYAGGATSRSALTPGTHDITFSDIVKQLAELENASALTPDGGRFPVVLHPYSWYMLMTDETFLNLFVHEAPDSAVRTGKTGTLLNCDIYVTNNARLYADSGQGGTTDVYTAMFLGREAYGVTGMAGLLPNLPVDARPADAPPMTGSKVKPVEVIMKPLGSSGALDPLNQRGSIGWKTSLDVKVLNSNWIRVLEHTALNS